MKDRKREGRREGREYYTKEGRKDYMKERNEGRTI